METTPVAGTVSTGWEGSSLRAAAGGGMLASEREVASAGLSSGRGFDFGSGDAGWRPSGARKARASALSSSVRNDWLMVLRALSEDSIE